MASLLGLTEPVLSTPNGPDVLRVVRQTERISGIVAIAVLILVPGLPLLRHLLRGEPLLGLANAVLLLVLAAALVALIEILILMPLAALRYRAAGAELRSELDRLLPRPLTRWQASGGPPAVLAIARDGHVLLADSSTGYAVVMLAPDDILSVEPVMTVPPPRLPRRGLGFGVGLPVGGGLVVPLVAPAARHPASRAEYAVSLGYRAEHGHAVRATRLRCCDAADAQCLALALRSIAATIAQETMTRQ